MPLAALPMYDLTELQPANDALWHEVAAVLRARSIAAPSNLTRRQNLETLWTDPDLLLAQTCGYPLATSLAGRVTLVATPCYAAPGCEGPNYCSAIIVQAESPAETIADLRGHICAINTPDSNSGMNLLRAAVAPFTAGRVFFRHSITTGSHAASVQAVATKAADIAAIDCITWAHLQRMQPSLTRYVLVLDWTESTPGLPLITALHTPPPTIEALRDALNDAATTPSLAEIRATLLLGGFEILPLSAYDRVLDLERQAQTAGYPALE